MQQAGCIINILNPHATYIGGGHPQNVRKRLIKECLELVSHPDARLQIPCGENVHIFA